MPGMPWPLPWPFDRTYMQLALVAAVAVGASAPLIGTFLVQKRLSLLGDGIGHAAVAGVGAGLLLDVTPTWSALTVAVAAALVVEWLRARGTGGDLALALVFYSGIAAGVVMASKSHTGTNIQPYLFGSILTVDRADAYTVLALAAAIVAAVVVCRRALLAVVLDEEVARVTGLPARFLDAMLAALTAVTIVAAMRVVGVLLVAALMVLPVATSRLVARSFRSTLAGGAVVGVLAGVLGLGASRVWGLAPGGTIVLVTTGLFAITAAVQALRRRATGSGALLTGGH